MDQIRHFLLLEPAVDQLARFILVHRRPFVERQETPELRQRRMQGRRGHVLPIVGLTIRIVNCTMLIDALYYHAIRRPGASPEFSCFLHTYSRKDSRLPGYLASRSGDRRNQEEKEIDPQ